MVLFIQQNLLSWDYGILDGDNLSFENNNRLGLIDVSVWITAVFASIFATNLIWKNSKNILAFVGLTSIIFTVVNIFQYGHYGQSYSLTETQKFNFSKTKNVIVLMFDAFQMDLFLEIMDKHPDIEAAFDGFTLYENNSAVFAKTYPSVPLFLAGERYQKKEPILEFFDRVYDDSLMTDLQNDGWDVGLYPEVTIFPSVINTIRLDPQIADNVIKGVPLQTKLKVYLRALDLSIFRSVPHQMKSMIFNDGQFWLEEYYDAATSSPENEDVKHHALIFDKQLKESGRAEIADPVFRFFHLAVPHSPMTLDRNLNEVRHSWTFRRFQDYSFAATTLMVSFLEELEALDIYENSAIIILSDHGLGYWNRKQYNPDTKSYKEIQKFGNPRSAAKSLLLIKEPGEHFPLRRSQKPTSGIDIAPTIASLAGVSFDKYEGIAVKNITEEQSRTRVFNFYKFTTWDSKYLNDFEQYEITGDVRRAKSWNSRGVLGVPEQIKNKPVYSFGEVLSYGRDVKSDSDFQNAFVDLDRYRLGNNYIISDDGTLSIELEFNKAPRPNETLLMQFEIYEGKTVERILHVNSSSISSVMEPTKRALNEGFEISPDMHQGHKNMTIRFSMPNEVNPEKLNFSTLKITKLSQ